MKCKVCNGSCGYPGCHHEEIKALNKLVKALHEHFGNVEDSYQEEAQFGCVLAHTDRKLSLSNKRVQAARARLAEVRGEGKS